MKTLTIARRIMTVVIAFGIAMPAAVGGLSYVLYRNASRLRKVSGESARQTDALFGLVTAVGRVQTTIQQVLREKDPDNLERLIAEGKTAGEQAQQKIQEAGAAQGSVGDAFAALRRANEKSSQYALRGDAGMAQQTLIEESNPAYETLLSEIAKVRQTTSRAEAVAASQAETSANRAQWTALTSVGALLVILLGASAAIVRGINASLQRAVLELSTASDSTAAAALQISRSSQRVAQGASQQAASLEETSAASQEVNAVTKQNVGNSLVAAEKMGTAARQVIEANERLEQMVASMAGISAASDKVSKIIRTIDEIAFQTNILALNAAVEAARAGEAGMGFAVVADEVRNLAQRSAAAAKDTAALIEESLSTTREGKVRLDQVAEAIRSITGSAQEAKMLVEEIRAGSGEQAKGIEQVSCALTQIERVTQQSAAGAEESASAGQQLTSQMQAMKATVARLAALVGG
jgi:methyl-accepting chemotaxis protein